MQTPFLHDFFQVQENFFDAATYDKTRGQIVEELAQIAQSIFQSLFLSLFESHTFFSLYFFGGGVI